MLQDVCHACQPAFRGCRQAAAEIQSQKERGQPDPVVLFLKAFLPCVLTRIDCAKIIRNS